MLRDIERGKDAEVLAVLKVIEAGDADIIALQGIDWDLELLALRALNDRLGSPYPHIFSLRPNTGMASDLDLDGDGKLRGAGDAQGFGRFAGQDGMAVLSRMPILRDEVVDLSALLWRDLPGARLPVFADGSPFPSAQAQAVQRLSTTGHWVVPFQTPEGRRLNLLTFHATPPVFDGPEDQNGLRNGDEISLWATYLDGQLTKPPPVGPVVLAGDFNLDPLDGDGRRHVFDDLLSAADLIDPLPRSAGGIQAADGQGGVNRHHAGDPALDTADWSDEAGRPGNMRVDYVLPSRDLPVLDKGVLWPAAGTSDTLLDVVEAASRHRLVFVDIDF